MKINNSVIFKIVLGSLVIISLMILFGHKTNKKLKALKTRILPPIESIENIDSKINSINNYLYDESFNNSPAVPYDKLMDEVTIIVPSFDKYSELWNPFFTFLFKHWPDLLGKHKNIPVILVSNFEEYKDNPRVTNIKVGVDISWSDNMITALHYVKTKYVLIILEDYIINKPVRSERIHELLHLLEENRGAYVEVASDSMFSAGFEKHKNFPPNRDDVIIRSRDNETHYRNSLQASLWNIKTLKKLLVAGESAWDFEIIGNKRTRSMSQPFYMVVKDVPFSYLNAVDKRKYQKPVVDYINEQGVIFKPSKLPIEEK